MINITKKKKRIQHSFQEQKEEKIWLTLWFPVRRHSRVLYLPIPREVSDIYGIEKHDMVKATLLRVKKAPRDQDDEENDS